MKSYQDQIRPIWCPKHPHQSTVIDAQAGRCCGTCQGRQVGSNLAKHPPLLKRSHTQRYPASSNTGDFQSFRSEKHLRRWPGRVHRKLQWTSPYPNALPFFPAITLSGLTCHPFSTPPAKVSGFPLVALCFNLNFSVTLFGFRETERKWKQGKGMRIYCFLCFHMTNVIGHRNSM